MRLSAALTGKPTSTDLTPRTASLAFASLDHCHWGRRWLEQAGLALPERDSLCPCARFCGDGSGASAPVLSNRPRWWQRIQVCRHSATRPKRFQDPPHHETRSRLASTCDTSHTETHKVSCPAPAPPPSLRNTAPMNQLLIECSDLPSAMVEATGRSPLHLKSVDGHFDIVRGRTRFDGWRRNVARGCTSTGVGGGIYLRGRDSFGRSLRG